LGIMLYEMVCGVLPFQPSKENYWAVGFLHLSQEPKAPRLLNAQIPEELEAVMLRTLAKEPEKRPTAAELRDLLAEFLSDETLPQATQTELVGSKNSEAQSGANQKTISAGSNQLTHTGTETQQAGSRTEAKNNEQLPVTTTVMPVSQSITTIMDSLDEKAD